MDDKIKNPTGYIVINARTARGSLPIEGALVEIRTFEMGTSDLIATLKTNSSGLTEALALAAPPVDESLEPGIANPFSSYNVSVKKEGYEPVNNIDVPIFSGITSIQPVEMIPRLEYSREREGTYDQWEQNFVTGNASNL